MTSTSLLASLRSRGVDIVVTRDALRYRPRSAVAPAEHALLHANRREILAILQQPTATPYNSSWSDRVRSLLECISDGVRRADLLRDFEERAGVLEFDAGLTRDAAEQGAFAALVASVSTELAETVSERT